MYVIQSCQHRDEQAKKNLYMQDVHTAPPQRTQTYGLETYWNHVHSHVTAGQQTLHE